MRRRLLFGYPTNPWDANPTGYCPDPPECAVCSCIDPPPCDPEPIISDPPPNDPPESDSPIISE